ncbi:hypothetical protein FPD46_00665 [Campylobacter peloridis]|uniref:Uncharacterized protein n=1 Tax=Campylobacter peloridis TaxID=488546 RepID=A0A5C7DNI0_9BACT|nr:hypothetical protein [Campylobacter peloridis]TXE84780.1 hypothetical protein FPD46_00665 [Campylobacter peloridis]
MLNVTINKVNFDELNIDNLSKRGILQTLEKFWNGNQNEYIEYLDNIGIEYYKNYKNIFNLNQQLNSDIAILQENINQGKYGNFNFKISTIIKNLKDINDLEYYKLNIDLRELNDKTTSQTIKDIFTNIDSVSLVDFKEINDERISLIYHKKGAIVFFDELIIANSRADRVNLIENFQVPKDNNFIVSRFILDFSRELLKENINESFSHTYYIGKKKVSNIKDVKEICYWGELNLKEKEEKKFEEKAQSEKENMIKEQAKSELKQENNNKRESLTKDSYEKIIQNDTSNIKLYNISSMEDDLNKNNLNETKEQNKIQIEKEQAKKEENEIEKIIKYSFEIYEEKEIEKTKQRLQKAQKEANEAYADLKNYLNNGTTILEAIRNIQQKYRNEDTVNFASLLFSKDILNLKNKEEEIKKLKDELDKSIKYEDQLSDEITKREETISKLKGTIQLKTNEIIAMREEFDNEIEQLKNNEEKIKEIEKILVEQEETINELDNENQKLSDDYKISKEKLIKLETENNILKERVKENKEERKYYEDIQKGFYRYQIELEKAKEEKEKLLLKIKKIEENERQNEEKINRMIEKMKSKENESDTTLRAKDIIEGNLDKDFKNYKKN